MTKKRKTVLYLCGGLIGVLVMVLLLRAVLNRPFTSQIPPLEENQTLSESIQEQLTEATKKAKRAPSAENLGTLGMIYHSNADYQRAGECYKVAIERDPGSWIWHYYQGYLFLEMGESNSVIESFNQVLDSHPEIHLARYYIGEEYMNLGDYSEAERYFNEIKDVQKSNPVGNLASREDHFPLSAYVGFQLSQIYANSNRVELAETTLNQIIQSNRTFGPAYRLLGNIYRSGGEMDRSDQYLSRANDLTIYSAPVDALVDRLALLSRSDLYLLKKIDEAVNGIYSQWALELIEHGTLYIKDSKYLLSKAIKTYLWLDMNQQAVSYTDQHVQLSKSDFNELYNMAMSFYNNEIYPISIRYFLKALLLKPEDNEIQKKLAICYWKNGQEELAVTKLDEIISMNPDNLEVLAEITDVMFFELEERTKSPRYLAMLNFYTPSNPKVQKMSAWTAESKGNFSEAITLYESSMEGDPEDLVTVKNLGKLFIRQQMWTEAISHYRRALEIHPNEPSFLERMATLLITCPDVSLRDPVQGSYYAERAFVHSASSQVLKISSGRCLSMAFAMLGEKQNANIIINMTIKLAQQERYSKAHMAELEKLSRQFQQMEEGVVVVFQ